MPVIASRQVFDCPAVLAAVGPFSERLEADPGEVMLLLDTVDILLDCLASQHKGQQAADCRGRNVEIEQSGIPVADADSHSQADASAAASPDALDACISWIMKMLRNALLDEEFNTGPLEDAVLEFLVNRLMTLTDLCSPQVWDTASEVDNSQSVSR